MPNILKYKHAFLLENGETLPELDIAYHTYGELNTRKDNAIWVFHALTGSSDAADWWSGLIGEGKPLDPTHHYIVCANMLGSSYGATNATSTNPKTGKPYGKDFPLITIRDVIHSHRILQNHLGINRIHLGIGASMGGQQALEWAAIDPCLFDHLTVIACSARMSAWAIAINEAQRMALKADPTLYDHTPTAGHQGMQAARAIGMLTYRTHTSYNLQQTDTNNKIADFKASSYQRYQGLKLSQRFKPLAYLSITQTMDSHNLGRGRGGVKKALTLIKPKTLVVAIQSDILFPKEEQAYLAAHLPNAQFALLNSPYGHDGFLIEFNQLNELVNQFLHKDLLKPNAAQLC
jgi:homoserine O-acetyltransferase/O-succinyltransferase